MPESAIPTAKKTRSTARAADTGRHQRKWLWLRLLLLAAMAVGLAMPLLVAAKFRLGARDSVRAAHQFLVNAREGNTVPIAELLTPKALGIDEDSVDEAASQPGAMRMAGTVAEIGAHFLQGFDFSLESPIRREELLDVPFVLHCNEDLPIRLLNPNEKNQKTIDNWTRMARENAQRGDGRRGILHLRQIGDKWRVAGMRVPPELGVGLVRQLRATEREFDFEKLGQFSRNWNRRKVELAPESLGPISAADFAAGWQIDVSADNRSARDVLRDLFGVANLSVTFSSLPNLLNSQDAQAMNRALAKPVSLQLRKVSRFQAAQAVCRPLGIHVNYQRGRPMLQLGRSSQRFAASGPFLLEANTVREDANALHATGTLHLVLHSTPFPPKIAAIFSRSPLLISNLRVSGPTREDLYHARKGVKIGTKRAIFQHGQADAFYLMFGAGSQSASWDVPLKNLLRDLDAIRELSCTIQVALPREDQLLRMEEIAPGSSATIGDFRLVLRQIETDPATLPSQTRGIRPAAGQPKLLRAQAPRQESKSPRVKRFDFHAEPSHDRRILWQSFDLAGNVDSGWVIPTPSGDFSLFLLREPVRLVFEVVTIGETLSWNYRLQNIPLHRLPRRIEPLRFAGHDAPVSSAEPRITERGVELRFTNHSQKQIDSLEVKLAYRDAKGRVLREVVRRLSTDAGDEPDAILSRSARQLQTVDAGDRPIAARSVTATVTEVFFKDATSWKR